MRRLNYAPALSMSTVTLRSFPTHGFPKVPENAVTGQRCPGNFQVAVKREYSIGAAPQEELGVVRLGSADK
jgi:hypothetical protein